MSSKANKTYLVSSTMFSSSALEKSIKSGHTQVADRHGSFAVVEMSHESLRKAAANGAFQLGRR